MPWPPRITVAGLLLLAGVAIGSCSWSGAPSSPTGSAVSPTAAGPGRELLVLGAASLSDVLEQLAAAYEADNPGLDIVLSTDGSDALRARIEEGAAADVFVSADAANPDRLARAGLTLGSPAPVAANGIVIAVAPQRRDEIRIPIDLAADGIRIVAAGRGVPITAYAQEAIDRLAGLDGYPPDYAARLEENVVSREDNVRAALAKVALGEGDAAFVYATDVRGRADLGVLELPPAAAVDAVYAAVALSASGTPDTARDFVAWLRTPPAQLILSAAGFSPVRP
jgi:molybdate transport system substrate-binding protein